MYDELSIKRLRKINGSFGGDVSERIPFYDLLLSYYKDIYIYTYIPLTAPFSTRLKMQNILVTFRDIVY